MAPPTSSQRRSRRRTTTLGVLATAALAALAATTPASAARVLTSGGGGVGGGIGGGQIAKAVRREEEKLQKQFQQRVGGGGWPAQQQKPLGGSFPVASCLCVFDADRSLTGLQDSGSKASRGNGVCPADTTFPAIVDKAFRITGALTLSELATNMKNTFCGRHCYLGVISAGDATGPQERDEIAKALGSEAGNLKMPSYKELKWTDASASPSPAPLVLRAPDKTKKFNQVDLIVQYYQKASGGAAIARNAIHFYDDEYDNVMGWKGKGYNAQQISCATRDAVSYQGHELGKCGGTVDEINNSKPGCNTCKGVC
jgi:hypothetical protein